MIMKTAAVKVEVEEMTATAMAVPTRHIAPVYVPTRRRHILALL